MRLIDADALKDYLKSLRHESKRFDDRGFTFVMCMLTENVCKDIDRQPTIEERKVGEWIEQDDGWDGVYYECSVCKEAFTLIDGTPSDNFYNFCPNCGADMRESHCDDCRFYDEECVYCPVKQERREK